MLWEGLFQVFVEEFFDLGKGDDVFPVVEVGVACAGYNHEELVVGFAGGDGQFLVGVAAEVERVGFLAVEYHDSVLDFAGAAHQREVYPGNC